MRSRHGWVGAATEAMESELAELSAHLEAATHRQLTLIRELKPTMFWAARGATSYAGWLSWRVGLAPGAAREKIRVARALGALPAIDDAFRAAKLSYSKVRALTRVADATNEAALLDMALCATAAHLELICRGIRRVERDLGGEVVARDAPPERWVRERVIEDGMVRIEAQLHPDEAALVWKAIELARGLGGDGVPIERADALVRMADAFVARAEGASEPHRCGAERAQVVLHLRADALAATRVATLDDGDRVPAETRAGGLDDGARARAETLVATLDDGTHVPAETFRRVACDATLVAARTDAAGHVIEVGRRRRVVSGSQRRALQIRDRRCRFPGCMHEAWVDAHHIEHWAHGGATELSNLVLLCPAHHRFVHEVGFSIALSASGDVEVRGPDGAIVPEVPPPATIASLDALRRITTARAASAGTPIDDETLRPWWDGRPPDLSACVAAAQRRAPPAATEHRRGAEPRAAP